MHGLASGLHDVKGQRLLVVNSGMKDIAHSTVITV